MRVGIAGVGFMGWMHFLACQRVPQARVAAICSRSQAKRAGDWREVHGNFGPPGARVDLSGVRTYQDLGDLLADPDIDLVDLCYPTHLHHAAALQALQAGKHVLVEKPIALTTVQAEEMIAAADAAGRMLMVGQVLPYFPEFAFALEAVQSDRYGKLRAAHFKRIIAPPDWSASVADASLTGGPAIDLHIHDTHFIRLLCGMPASVSARGLVEGQTASYLSSQYNYRDKVISCTSGAIARKSRPFVHGFEMYLERATLTFDSSAGPLQVWTEDGPPHVPALADGEPVAVFARELAAVADAVATGRVPEALSAEFARDALQLCEQEVRQVRALQR